MRPNGDPKETREKGLIFFQVLGAMMATDSPKEAIAYEVTADVDETYRAEFERFMTETHIPDLIATGCFRKAHFERSASGIFRTRYKAIDRVALDRYFAEHAERLRGHVAEVFPIGIRFTREEWETLASF